MGKKEKHFLLPMQKVGVKTQNGGRHLLVLYIQRCSKITDLGARMGATTGKCHPGLLKPWGQKVCFRTLIW
jgi:hypothetical protein